MRFICHALSATHLSIACYQHTSDDIPAIVTTYSRGSWAGVLPESRLTIFPQGEDVGRDAIHISTQVALLVHLSDRGASTGSDRVFLELAADELKAYGLKQSSLTRLSWSTEE